MRRGGVLGLAWGDIFPEGFIRVTRSLYRSDYGETKGQLLTKPPKSKAGFPDLLFHELRHTQATRLLVGGADLKTVQHRLGHFSATFTANAYAHVDEASARYAATRMETILNGEKKSKAKKSA